MPVLAQAQVGQLQFPAWLWSPEAGAVGLSWGTDALYDACQTQDGEGTARWFKG